MTCKAFSSPQTILQKSTIFIKGEEDNSHFIAHINDQTSKQGN